MSSSLVTMRVDRAAVMLLLAICFIVQTVSGSYVITTPRKWTAGSKAQICMVVSDKTPGDQITVSVYKQESNSDITKTYFLTDTDIVPVGDGPQSCKDVRLYSNVTASKGVLEIRGRLSGKDINETRFMDIVTNNVKTFVQTDKYLYKAGQKVQFRVLTITGAFFKVSTEQYSEIFVETPSGTRIAQWLNVTNPSGLVHLDMQLIEEPEEGIYKIKVKSRESSGTTTKTFKIEDYVLPRFEVKINPPKYLLATAEFLELEICAKYTFGQPVKGNASVNIINNGYGRHRVEMNFKDQVFGCKTLEIPTLAFGINGRNYFVYSLTANVEVEEEGTGTVFKDKTDIDITRTVLTIKDDDANNRVTKPELPFIKTVNVAFPDGTPAALEPMEVCLAKLCRNMTTDAAGKLVYTIPPHLVDISDNVKSLNYPERKLPNNHRNFMYGSSYNSHSKHSFSPTNSSLLMIPESDRISCRNGQAIDVKLSIMYAAVNTSQADLYIQVISRGQIQFWTAINVKFDDSELNIDEASLIAPMEPPKTDFMVRGKLVIPISLPSTLSPKAHVLVWYSRDDGEVVSDTVEINVDKCLEHQVTLAWPLARVEQGTTLPLTLSAQPNSLCSLGIVDKSVELLSSSEDSLTLQKIFDIAERSQLRYSGENSQISDYDYCNKKPTLPLDPTISGRFERSSPPRFGRPRLFTVLSDAMKMFDDSGVFVISDLTIETRPCEQRGGYSGGAGGGMVFNSIPQAAGGFAQEDAPLNAQFSPGSGVGFGGSGGSVDNDFDLVSSISPSNEPEPRTYFPETWLWELNSISSTGDHVQNLTLPDTITEWVGKAVCVHPTSGIGLSNTASITTFTPFFIDLTVLPSVKNGEIMPIIISVFNYLETSLPVRIVLESSSEYEILGVNGTDAILDQNTAGLRSVCIPSNDKETVTVRVRPLAVGDINVTVMAEVDSGYPEKCGPKVVVNKVDRIISPINVEYEGFPREKTWTKYMCSQDLNENLDFFDEWRLEAPVNIVPESERAWVTVVGDLLGPTLENLGHLIKMPYGCGEQNMLNFAPNIYVMQYLEASAQNTGAIVEKLTKYMRNGYQRELNYKHRDGSYSAFGESDSSGSTWLTAFVVKSYAQAQQYISVDSAELNMSRDWLKNKQLENGCFESVGKVLHKGMKGGLSEGAQPRVLTAYVMAALLEAGEAPTDAVMANALLCLRNPAYKKSVDPYELALTAYALNLARLPEADEIMVELMALAVNTPKGLYWKLPSTKGNSDDSKTPAVAVETAGYALMAMMAKDPSLYSESSHRVVKWISAQRNSQGGFISTQDTVVALQALAMYESNQSQEPQDLMVSATGVDLAASFKIVESNKLLSQRAEVPNLPTNVLLDMAGTGCALVQAVVRYNVKDPEPSEAFSMSVTTSPVTNSKKCNTHTIRACASYLLNDGESNMAVIEVNLVSGYIPVKADLKRVVGYGTGIFKRYEVDGNKVLFYVDQFTSQETCAEFKIIREVHVENAKPGTVKVYDYYEPEFSISEKYELQEVWFCNDRPDIFFGRDDIIPNW